MGFRGGSEEQFPCWDDLLGVPGGAGGAVVLLVKVRVSLEHDERLRRVEPHVLRQAGRVQELLPAGIAGVEDLGVGVCEGKNGGKKGFVRRGGRR